MELLQKINNTDSQENKKHRELPRYFESFVKLSKERTIFLSTEFTKEISSGLAALLLHYDHQDQDKDITIYINSEGGDVAALTCIYDVMQMIKAPVKTVAIGKCYSAGAFLLASGSKGKRYVFTHAEIMIHKLQVGFPIINKVQIDQESYLKFLSTINDNIMKILVKHTGQNIKKIKQDFNGMHDIFLDAKQTVAYGLADHIL